MNQNQEAPMQDEAEQTEQVQDVQHFFELLNDWHARRVAALEHMLDIPEGTEVMVENETTIVLEGDVLRAFRAGLVVSLMQLGRLPFSPVDDEADEAIH